MYMAQKRRESSYGVGRNIVLVLSCYVRNTPFTKSLLVLLNAHFMAFWLRKCEKKKLLPR